MFFFISISVCGKNVDNGVLIWIHDDKIIKKEEMHEVSFLDIHRESRFIILLIVSIFISRSLERKSTFPLRGSIKRHNLPQRHKDAKKIII